jgi:hypothetical protein
MGKMHLPVAPHRPRSPPPSHLALSRLHLLQFHDHTPTHTTSPPPECLQKAGFVLESQVILWIFLPICRAVQAMHSMDPPMAHRYACMEATGMPLGCCVRACVRVFPTLHSMSPSRKIAVACADKHRTHPSCHHARPSFSTMCAPTTTCVDTCTHTNAGARTHTRTRTRMFAHTAHTSPAEISRPRTSY